LNSLQISSKTSIFHTLPAVKSPLPVGALVVVYNNWQRRNQ
jgi:hypothetical protein